METYNIFNPSEFAIYKLKNHGKLESMEVDVKKWIPDKNINCNKILTQLEKTENILGYSKS